MKTLYINLNGVAIQSSEDVHVVGKPEDAIVNKFYYELGKEILKGVDVSITRDINKKGIITAFMARDKEAHDAIWKEWEVVKEKLLAKNPTGPHKVKLPIEYISWLNNNSQTAYSEIAKSLHGKDGVVEISIDKIYRNAIGIIVNSIETYDYKQFVVNDRCVTDDSAISLAIMEKVKGVVFVPFDDFGKSPKCGKNPYECNPVCPKCGKNPCECKNNIVFAIANDDISYKSMFQLYDISGQLIDNRHFLMIFDDDFDFRRNIHYDRLGHFISKVEPFGETKSIRPLLGFCVEDQYLYLILKEAIIKICDYSNGECVNNKYSWDKNGGYIFYSRKNVGIEDNFIIINKGQGKSIYEISGLQVIRRGEYANCFNRFKRWIFEQDKYNYEEEYNHLWPIVVETKERIEFNGYRSVFYLGLTEGGQELFVAEPEDISVNEDWHVINKEKKIFFNIRFEDIVSISKDRKYIVSSNAIDGHVGISSIDGKMIVGQQYTTIKEVENSMFKLENAEHEVKYFLIKNNFYCQNIFKDFIRDNNSLISRQSNNIVINDCVRCTYIMSDLYHYIDTNNNGWIINKEGEKINPCPTQSSFNSYGVILSWKGKIEQTIAYRTVDGCEDYFKVHWYEPWKRDEIYMFSKDIVYIRMFRHKRRYVDEVKECLLSMDGSIIFSRTHDKTLPTIIKLSEKYFSAPVSEDSLDRGIFDMTGKRVVSLSGRKIVII